MPKSSRDIIKFLKANGFIAVSSRGSHHKYVNYETDKQTIVPHPKKDVPDPTIKQIEKQSGLDIL